MSRLTVDAEHGTTGVWLDGAPVDDLRTIGFSDQLQGDFKKWSNRYTHLAMSVTDDALNPLWIEFNQTGHDLAARLKRECKDRFEVEHRYYKDNSDVETVEIIYTT